MSSVIVFDGVSKCYRLGSIGNQTLYQDLNRWWAKVRRKPDPLLKIMDARDGKDGDQFIWALRNINLEIQHGEVVGVIGRNGAGKSTLLKILSQITAPTTGEIKIKGRIASLLEVGTGFHPELTGRENIYLNGALLGMSKEEIQRKFDEIVDFSDVEQFIDTPVKRYSSGMYVRLAFAVAAHIEPDILLVDEVLAVGDAQFQKKCLGKISDVSQKEGRTVLFVSHNMGMITSLCKKAVLLDNGCILVEGNVTDVVTRYYNAGISSPYAVDFRKQGKKVGDQYATLLEVHIEDMEGNLIGEVDIRAPFKLKMTYDLHGAPVAPRPNFYVISPQGQYVFVTGGGEKGKAIDGTYEATCIVPGNLLNNETYTIDAALLYTDSIFHYSFHERGAVMITVIDPIDETIEETTRYGMSGPLPGAVRPKLPWEVRKIA
ncbi:MAG TPA: ABC transporter ATP-binding protein [Caldisericia bacterium]|nr:ABC transporter ATP-binding protein [Caldisericia bacterium]